jgi:hypothetical protein
MKDDFMFRQNDVFEYQGINMRQKHMYAYGMLDKDLFVNVHLSKLNYNKSDSVQMREMMGSLAKKQ